MKKYIWLLPLLTLVLMQIACGSSTNTGKKVGEIGSEPTKAADQAPSAANAAEATPTASGLKQETFAIGDIIELKDHRMRMNGADYKGGILKINLTIENTGEKELNVSSMLSLSAKDGEGTKLDQEIFDCGTSFDGSVLPGDKLKGDVCYTLPAAGQAKVYYESNMFSSGAVVWVLDTGNLTTLAEPTADPNATSAVKAYVAGDIIELNDQNIVLNSAVVTGTTLKANFTIENTGTKDLNVSSLLSFSAKSPDGTKLEQEFMDCGSMIDGTVLPGDKVKGDICWTATDSTGLKIYFDASLFGAGSMVWEVK